MGFYCVAFGMTKIDVYKSGSVIRVSNALSIKSLVYNTNKGLNLVNTGGP